MVLTLYDIAAGIYELQQNFSWLTLAWLSVFRLAASFGGTGSQGPGSLARRR
jgi:hypothetical protein